MRRREILTAFLMMLLATGSAFAHAHLDHAEPPVSGTVKEAPHETVLYFTQNLEPSFSTVKVTDAGGAEMNEGQTQFSGNTMRVGLKPLGPGTYTVHWHAVSVDTHTTEGTFTFSVSP
jgi:methionine-rich copper-binding protein CopC